MAKSSAIPYAFRGQGLKGIVAHLSSIVLGDAKFNRAASTIDMRQAYLKFPRSLRELLLQTCPNFKVNEVDAILKEAQVQVKRNTSQLQSASSFPEQWDSGVEMQILLYSLIRLTQPAVVIETGTANGKSTAAICLALSKNRLGHVWSFDVLETTAPLVNNKHRNFLTLVKTDGKSSTLRKEIARIKPERGFSIFLHDSDHSYPNQLSDYTTAQSLGFDLILSDDIDASLAFCDFANAAGSAFLDAPKFIGVVSNTKLSEMSKG